MMRSLVLAGTLLLAVAGGSGGQAPASDAPPPNTDPNRFTFYRTDDGYVRLDLRSGEVSYCRRAKASWECVATADERAAYDAEISRLQAENVALKKALLEHGLGLPKGLSAPPVSPSAPKSAQNPVPEAKLPSDAEIDRIMSIFERIWRRLVEMMQNLQHAPDKT